MYKVMPAFVVGGPGDTKHVVRCALPLRADQSEALVLRARVQELGRTGEIDNYDVYMGVPRNVDPFEAAMMLPAVRAGIVRGHTRSSNRASVVPDSLPNRSSLMASAALPPIQQLGTVNTYGIGQDLFIDYFYIEAVLDAIWKYNGDFVLNYTPYGPDCDPEQELIEQLSELIVALDQAIDAVEEENTYGSPLEKRMLCPDSLMGPEDTCADFYIASMSGMDILKFFGINIGNGRGPNPFAKRQESKLQLVPDLDNGKMHLLVSNSVISGTINFPSGTGWGPNSYVFDFPPSPLDIDRFDVTRVSATRYVVDLKIENSMCGTVEQTLSLQSSLSPSNPLFQQLVEAMCPAIDATLTYDKVDGKWRPTFVERDAFPTLDIWRKTSAGDMILDHHSEERNMMSGLMGLTRLREQIRRERDRLQNDPTCLAY